MTDAALLREAADRAEWAASGLDAHPGWEVIARHFRADAALLRAVADECDERLGHYWIANSEPFTFWEERVPAAALALADAILGDTDG